MKISMTNNLQITGVPGPMLKKIRTTFTLRNPAYDDAAKMGRWLGSLKEYLYLYSECAGAVTIPRGAMSLILTYCRDMSTLLELTTKAEDHDTTLKAMREIRRQSDLRKLKAHALDWLEDRIIESFEKYHTRIVCIDHLHYLVDMARMKSPSLEIGTVIRRLKGIAVNNELLVFLLCHTTKGKHDGTLSYESIRDSSFVSQESDSVFMVKRTPEDGENTAKLRVEFHRRTGVMEKVVYLVKVNGLLQEAAVPLKE